MTSSLDSLQPRTRRGPPQSGEQLTPDYALETESVAHTLASGTSSVSGGMSRTPPLPPPACVARSGGYAQQGQNPMEEFSQEKPNLDASDRCLAAACSLLQFEIAEVWTYAGHVSESEGKAVEPMCLHVYVKPATIESFGANVQGVWTDDNERALHSLSPLIVDRARMQESPLWYTSMHPDTPLHASLPLNTAVALPISLSIFRKDVCVVFFAAHDVNRTDMAVSVLTQLSKAAGLAMSSAFAAHDRHAGRQPKTLPARWDELVDVEFMVNGSRCTIYTAFYRGTPVVVKVVRKDAVDKEIVRKELELEMGLLMRLHHPNIVRLIGGGTYREQFLMIERLDGGTLAQRCGNALNVRDRRRRFRRRRPFLYEELLRQGLQLAQALHYMHNDAMPGKLVLHRDLKPDNVAFDSDGNLKLIDLGLGRVVSRSQEEDAVYKMTGETGSLRYMAPEVAMGKPYNGAADVYGFAMILWEMATTKKPFAEMGREQFLIEVVGGGQRPHLNKTWPPQFVELLKSCWHEDMYKRMKFEEVMRTLQSLLDDAAATAAKARSVQKPGQKRFGLFRAGTKKHTTGTLRR